MTLALAALTACHPRARRAAPRRELRCATRSNTPAPPNNASAPDASDTPASAPRVDGGVADAAGRVSPVEGPSGDAGAGALRACVNTLRERVPAELASALSILGYAPHEDVCRLELAAQLRDHTLCAGIGLTALRSACDAHAAIVVGDPGACPDATLDRGRDPVCVALASRAIALCNAGGPEERARCHAIARGAPRECDALPEGPRERCHAELRALSPAVGPLREPRSEGPNGPMLPELTLETPARTTALLPREADAGAPLVERFAPLSLTRGAWLTTDAQGARVLLLLDPRRGWPAAIESGLAPAHDPVLAAQLIVPARAGAGTLRAMRVVMPGDGAVYELLQSPPPTVRFERVPRTRGDTLTLALHGFVRDIATLEMLSANPEAEPDVAPGVPH